jgi:hypothetical protein
LLGSRKTKNLSRIATGCDSRRFIGMGITNDGLSLITQEIGYVQVDSITVRKTVYVREIDASNGQLLRTIFESPHQWC